jgi:hypothetical protein
MSRAIVLMLATVALIPAAHSAAPAQPSYTKAYGFALRCFVADGVAIPKAADDPDGTVTKVMRERARKAFDTVYFMGGKLGYSDRKIAGDLDHAQGMEMRLMVQNPDYFAQTKTDCIKLGLM